MSLRHILVAALFGLLPTAVLASPCDRSQWDRADHYASRAAQDVVRGNDGGQDIRHRMLECDYNTYSNIFRLQVEVMWNGAMVRSNHYWTRGEMTFGFEGNNGRYAEAYPSETLRRYRSEMGFVRGFAAVVMLADQAPRRAAPAPAPAPTPAPVRPASGSEVQVHNTCGQAVVITLRWYESSRAAYHSARWDVASGDRTYLVAQNRRITTTDTTFLLHVETPAGATLVSGPRIFEHQGRSYGMSVRTSAAGSPMRFRLCN